jgi:hypothetical protein
MLFWKEALKALCHGMGAGMVKEKAVGELLTRLSRCGTAVDRPREHCLTAAHAVASQTKHACRMDTAETREPGLRERHKGGARMNLLSLLICLLLRC